jgi:hypothetical protein
MMVGGKEEWTDGKESRTKVFMMAELERTLRDFRSTLHIGATKVYWEHELVMVLWCNG